MKKYCIFSIYLFAFLVSMPAPAYDNSREILIAERLEERIKLGKPMWLESGNGEFFVIRTEQMTREPQGAVVLLHGIGAHPDWPVVISQLRKSLPQQGWSTLSVQLPVLPPEHAIADYGKTLDEARRRIGTALEYLREQQIEPVVIIGYSFGAATAFSYSASLQETPSDLLGVVGISAVAQPFMRPPVDLLAEIEGVKIPVLDIYGSRDFPEIVDSAADRRLAARKGENPWYQQIEIEGADHNYSGLGNVLSKRISGWLKKLIEDYRSRQSQDADT